jgi:AcrR family transcriptional regulator
MGVLERDGVDGLTVRAIAREAGANVAAVNYHYGSKEALVEQMQLAQMQAGFVDPLARLDMLLAMPGLRQAEALQQFLAGFIRDMARYPRTTEAYLHDALVRQEYDGVALRALNTFLEQFLERVRDMLLEGDDTAQRISLAQLWSAVLFLGVLPKAMEPFVRDSLVSDERVEQYAWRLVAQFFPRAP